MYSYLASIPIISYISRFYPTPISSFPRIFYWPVLTLIFSPFLCGLKSSCYMFLFVAMGHIIIIFVYLLRPIMLHYLHCHYYIGIFLLSSYSTIISKINLPSPPWSHSNLCDYGQHALSHILHKYMMDAVYCYLFDLSTSLHTSPSDHEVHINTIYLEPHCLSEYLWL